MTRPREAIHSLIPVILGPLILVHDAHADGRAQRDAELRAGLDLDPVLLIAGCGDGGLARPPTCELRLNV